jgi:hypothetical protein
MISRTHLFLPHDLPPTKKSSTIKSWLHFAINISGNSPFGNECSWIWKLSGNFTFIQFIKKCRDFLGRDISGTTFFLGPNLVSFNRAVVPYDALTGRTAIIYLLRGAYLLTLLLFAGVSRVRALSPTWTGSHARETLISRTISPQQKTISG